MRHLALLAILFAAACGEKQPPREDPSKTQEQEQGNGNGGRGHGHAPKMGGQLLDLEHVVQLEFVHDAKDGTLKIYVWDGHVSYAETLEQKTIEVELRAAGETILVSCAAQANKLTGETVGDSATFLGRAPELRGIRGLRGKVRKLEALGQTWKDVEFDLAKDEE